MALLELGCTAPKPLLFLCFCLLRSSPLLRSRKRGIDGGEGRSLSRSPLALEMSSPYFGVSSSTSSSFCSSCLTRCIRASSPLLPPLRTSSHRLASHPFEAFLSGEALFRCPLLLRCAWCTAKIFAAASRPSEASSSPSLLLSPTSPTVRRTELDLGDF